MGTGDGSLVTVEVIVAVDVGMGKSLPGGTGDCLTPTNRPTRDFVRQQRCWIEAYMPMNMEHSKNRTRMTESRTVVHVDGLKDVGNGERGMQARHLVMFVLVDPSINVWDRVKEASVVTTN